MINRGFVLSMLILTASLTSCGNSVDQEELERLRKENEDLKAALAAQTDQTTASVTTTAIFTTTVPITTTPTTTTSETTTTTMELDDSVWILDHFVDKWGEEDLEAPFIWTVTENGTFTNSASLNEQLSTKVAVSPDYSFFTLYPFGASEFMSPDPVRSYNRDVYYDIVVLDESSSEHYLSGIMFSQDTQLCLIGEDYEKLVSILASNDVIKVICTKKDDESGFSFDDSKYEYKFTLECTSFESSYIDMTSKKE